MKNIIGFLKSIYFFFKYRPKVSKIVWENNSTFSIYISGRYFDFLDIKAGQYLLFRFLKKKIWYREYPLSLSALPVNNEFRVTIKNVSQFTDEISKLKVGQTVFFHGPYGSFIEESENKKYLLIAGGVAVSVALTIFESLLNSGNNVFLINSVSSEDDVLFKKEIDELALKYGGKVIYFLSGKEGRLNQQKIQSLVPDFSDREMLIYGSKEMTESLKTEISKIE